MAIIYKVTSPSNSFKSYLMGTFHVFVPEFSPLIEKAEKLIS